MGTGIAVGTGSSFFYYQNQLKDIKSQLTTLELKMANAPMGLNVSVTGRSNDISVTAAIEKVSPEIETVVATIPGGISFFGRSPDQQVSGSGVIISSEGYVLTNHHVIDSSKDIFWYWPMELRSRTV